eukprot:949585_1
MFLISSFVLDRVPFRSFPSVNSPSFFFQFFVFDLLQLFQYLDLSLHCTQLHSWSHSHSPVSTSNRVDPFNYFHLNLHKIGAIFCFELPLLFYRSTYVHFG